MKLYRVFESPSKKPRAIKVGWSWPAFLFSPFWILLKGLWFDFVLLLIFHTCATRLTGKSNEVRELFNSSFEPLYDVSFFLIILTLQIVIGTYGNKMLRRKLLYRGFLPVGTYKATSAEAALAEHYRAKLTTVNLNSSEISAQPSSAESTTSHRNEYQSQIPESSSLPTPILFLVFILILVYIVVTRDKNDSDPIPAQSNSLNSTPESFSPTNNWESDVKQVINLMKSKKIPVRKASSTLSFVKNFPQTSPNDHLISLDDNTVKAIEDKNIWWTYSPKSSRTGKDTRTRLYIRLHNPTQSNLLSLIFAHTKENCKYFDKQNKNFVYLDLTQKPLKPNESAVYFTPLPFEYTPKSDSTENYDVSECGVITSAIAERPN
jgi:hypothetical protein